MSKKGIKMTCSVVIDLVNTFVMYLTVLLINRFFHVLVFVDFLDWKSKQTRLTAKLCLRKLCRMSRSLSKCEGGGSTVNKLQRIRVRYGTVWYGMVLDIDLQYEAK